MLRNLISIVFVFSSLSFAAPPEIACLSDLSVAEAFEQKKHFRPKNIIFLVSNGGFDTETWSRSIWNDPEFVEHLKEKRITVAYMDRESDPVLFKILNISSLPTFVFYHDGILTRRRGILATTPEVRDSYIKWIDAARIGTTRSRQLERDLKDDPANVELRFKLVNELDQEGQEAKSLDHFYWLLDHNEIWFQFNTAQIMNELVEIENPEMSFRVSIMWFVMGARESLGLFKEEKSRLEGFPARDGWTEAMRLVEEDRVNTEIDRKKEVLVNLRRTFVARRDDSTATDRDLFILKVLTVEGEEGRLLAEEMKPYFE